MAGTRQQHPIPFCCRVCLCEYANRLGTEARFQLWCLERKCCNKVTCRSPGASIAQKLRAEDFGRTLSLADAKVILDSKQEHT